MNRWRNKILAVAFAFFCVLTAGFVVPAKLAIPVLNASSADWNSQTFCTPWGAGRVHKGIDIFAREGTPVISSCPGVVIYAGNLSRGGNVALVLGAKWRLHYYAHLKTTKVLGVQWVSAGEEIGSVGTTGNAAGKQPHLHYSIVSLIPHINRFACERHGVAKMFYLNPHEELLRL